MPDLAPTTPGGPTTKPAEQKPEPKRVAPEVVPSKGAEPAPANEQKLDPKRIAPDEPE